MKILFVGYGSIAKKHNLVLKKILNNKIKIYALRHKKKSKKILDVNNIY